MIIGVDLMRRTGLIACLAILLVTFGAGSLALGDTSVGALVIPQGQEGDPLDSNDYSDLGDNGDDGDDSLYLPPNSADRSCCSDALRGGRRLMVLFVDSGLGVPVIKILVLPSLVVSPEAGYAR